MKRVASRDDGYLALKCEDLKRIGQNICAVQHRCVAVRGMALRIFVGPG
jgi:hypothetical protein